MDFRMGQVHRCGQIEMVPVALAHGARPDVEKPRSSQRYNRKILRVGTCVMIGLFGENAAITEQMCDEHNLIVRERIRRFEARQAPRKRDMVTLV